MSERRSAWMGHMSYPWSHPQTVTQKPLVRKHPLSPQPQNNLVVQGVRWSERKAAMLVGRPAGAGVSCNGFGDTRREHRALSKTLCRRMQEPLQRGCTSRLESKLSSTWVCLSTFVWPSSCMFSSRCSWTLHWTNVNWCGCFLYWGGNEQLRFQRFEKLCL